MIGPSSSGWSSTFSSGNASSRNRERAAGQPVVSGPDGVLPAVLLQGSDELLGLGCFGGGARAGLPVVVQGGARVVQRVADPAVTREGDGDGLASLSGSVDISPCFLVLDGLLIVAQRLAGVPGPSEDDAKLVLDDCACLVVVGGGRGPGTAGSCGRAALRCSRSTGSASPAAWASSNLARATAPS